MKNLKFIQDVSWEALFENWKQDEAGDFGWQELALKKGWGSWEAWRRHMADQFQAPERQWKLYQVQNPNVFIPKMLVGPFQGWQHIYLRESPLPFSQRTFEYLVKFQQEKLGGHSKIKAIANSFPIKTQLIGAQFPGGQIVCLEGTHRSTAVALAQVKNQSINFSNRVVTIALTEIKEGWEIFEKMLNNG